jgi:Tol biopolymer transport system component
MTDDVFGRDLDLWLREDAAHRVPDHLGELLEQTAAAPQRRWWSSPERWLPMDLTARTPVVAPARIGRLAVAILVILAIVGLAIVAAGSRQPRVPQPFGLARNGAVMDWNTGDIYLADSPMSQPRTIISGPENDIAPLLTRDGTRFAFLRGVSSNEVLVMLANTDGSNIRQVLDTPMTDLDWLEWGAGNLLAVVHSDGSRRVLSIIDVDTGAMTTPELGLNVDNDVYWVPTAGQSLVFTAQPPAQPDSTAIYTIRADGSGLTALVPRVTGPFYNGLDVSADGSTVAYWNYEADGSPDGMGSHVHFLDLAGGAERRVTFDPSADGETDLRFSPDGVHVVLQREAGNQAQLLIASIDGSSPARLVGPRFSIDAEPGYGFSPDGKTVFLAFRNSRPKYIDVATGDVATGPAPFSSFAGYQRLAP